MDCGMNRRSEIRKTKGESRMKKWLMILLATGCALLCAAPAVTAEEGEAVHPEPIAWYTFDDPSNIGADTSGNGNHLLLKGNPAALEKGKYGSGVYFDGKSALVAQPDDNGKDVVDALADTTKQFTLTYWIKTTKEDMNFVVNDWRRVISNGADWGISGGGNSGFTIINNPDVPSAPSNIINNPVIHFNNNDPNTHVYAQDNQVVTPFDEGWNFVAVSVDAVENRVQYYLNGLMVANIVPRIPAGATHFDFANLSAPFTYGAAYHADNPELEFMAAFKGAMDQAGIFDKVLNADEIAYVMNNLEVPDEVPDTGDGDDAPSSSLRFGRFYEGDNVVFKFDGIRNIHKSITKNNYCVVGLLDKSIKLKFWGDGAFVENQFAAQEDRFSLDDYKFMKIKYCSGTANPNSVFMFSTTKQTDYTLNGMLGITRKNERWDEQVFDMSALEGWEGNMVGWQLMPAPQWEETDAIFIEYIAFFKTQEDADQYGGMTQEQKRGEDEVSLYFSRGYVNPYLKYGQTQEIQSKMPWIKWLLFAGGGAVVLAIAVLVTVTVCKRKRRTESMEDDA